MDKIELIKEAIDKAERRESKLTADALNVPMLGSLQIRHLLNNLGAISSAFLDVGSHVGGSYCSAVFKNNNLQSVTAVDSWESDTTEGCNYEQQFRENVIKYGGNQLTCDVIKGDCFDIDLKKIYNPNQFGIPVDLYSYDAGHSRSQQREALVYYKPVLAETFIYCCDDWVFDGVKLGTMEGIEEAGYEILFQQELLNDNGELYQNEQWWDGYGVFLLKKKNENYNRV